LLTVSSFIPFFLGGVNVGSGNKPPWTLPAKATYGKLDSDRAKKYHKMEKIEVSDFFPPLTILVLYPLLCNPPH
jgi:glutathione S-transferase kappa 1